MNVEWRVRAIERFAALWLSPQSSDFVLVRGAALCLLIDSDEDIRSSMHVTRKWELRQFASITLAIRECVTRRFRVKTPNRIFCGMRADFPPVFLKRDEETTKKGQIDDFPVITSSSASRPSLSSHWLTAMILWLKSTSIASNLE